MEGTVPMIRDKHKIVKLAAGFPPAAPAISQVAVVYGYPPVFLTDPGVIPFLCIELPRFCKWDEERAVAERVTGIYLAANPAKRQLFR